LGIYALDTLAKAMEREVYKEEGEEDRVRRSSTCKWM